MKDIHPKRYAREKIIKDRLSNKSYTHKKAHPVAGVIKYVFEGTGLAALGYRNAQKVKTKRIEIRHPNIGNKFDNFKIMFIADFHLNGNPAIIPPIKKILKKEEVDIYLFGGDYQVNAFGNYAVVKSLYEELFSNIDNSKIYAVLGNHDEFKIAEDLDKLGVNMLLNDFVTIKRGKQALTITGIEDSDRYLAQEFPELPVQHSDYRILLAHSPNIYKEAQENGYDLLLAGHTHSGQICYPGGIPIVRFTKFPRKYSYSTWNYKGMQGYTTAGVGNTWVNVRFFCPPEIVILTLKS